MNNLLVFILFFSSQFVFSTPNVKIYYEEINNGFNIFCDNLTNSEISIELSFELDNMYQENNKSIHVIKANEDKHLITKLTSSNRNSPYTFKYRYWVNYGNHFQKKYDTDYKYYLPYEKGKKFYLSQGYNGKFSHQNENALDFIMPEGTPVHAVRAGIVVDIVEKNKLVCPKKKCAKFANYITIQHNDGTFAQYVHLKQNGSIVKLRDNVKKGQKIGYSGNTGWSTQPHLHLSIYLQRLRSRETLKTKFMIDDGSNSDFLIEKTSYNRAY